MGDLLHVKSNRGAFQVELLLTHDVHSRAVAEQLYRETDAMREVRLKLKLAEGRDDAGIEKTNHAAR